MPGQIVPPLIRWEQNCRNGQSPSSSFYAQAIHAQNFNMVHRTREVYCKTWPLGVGAGGSGVVYTLARIRTRHGASRLRVHCVLLPSTDSDGTDPRVTVSVSDGSTTESVTFYAPVQSATATDAPDNWNSTGSYVPVASATTYTITIAVHDFARPAAVMVHEELDDTVDPAVDYFNSHSPGVGVPLFSSLRERLLAGSVAMWKQGGGTLVHWSQDDGTARTRSSATLANLIDGSTTGSPATSAPGWYIDGSYRHRLTATGVDYELAVLAQTSSGTGGTVRITDSGGTDRISITGIGTTLQWYTATGLLSTSETWYAPRFACDGSATLSVYALSLCEWVA